MGLLKLFSNTNGVVKDALNNITQCIVQVLSVDVRSAWQTKKARKGKFQAERSSRLPTINTNSNEQQSQEQSLCTQQIDNLLIKYTVQQSDFNNTTTKPTDAMIINTDGSGADDLVFIQEIELIQNNNNNNNNNNDDG